MKTLRITFNAILISFALATGCAFGDSERHPLTPPAKLTAIDQEKKAKATIIENFELVDTPVATALKMFTASTGIKVKYLAPEKIPTRITMTMRHIPASEALACIANLANLKFRYEEDGVNVVPIQ